jgi:glycosyltransferase involved in cell wall biosynthesis
MDKIVFILPSTETGGTEKQMIKFHQYLRGKGEQSYLLSLKESSLKEEGVKSIKTKSRLLKTVYALYFLFKLKPDTVYAFFASSLIISWIYRIINRNCFIIAGVRNKFVSELSGFIKIEKFALNGVNLIIANSQQAKEFYEGRSKKRIEVIPNILFQENIDYNAVQSLRQKYKQGGEIIIGMIARFTPVKNHLLFLNVIEALVRRKIKMKVLMVGGGSKLHKEKVLDEIGKRKLKKYIDIIDVQNDIVPYYKVCDITVSCSKSEGFPNVVFESLIYGTPVVSFLSSDTLSVIPKKYIAESENDFAQKIISNLSEKVDDILITTLLQRYSFENQVISLRRLIKNM